MATLAKRKRTKANESFDNGVFFYIEAKLCRWFRFAQLAKGKKSRP
jgi:hypothetical protein